MATAAVQNLLGGDEAMARSRTPQVYSDAAYAIFTKPAREYTGQSLLCEDVLLDSGGVTDLSVYDCIPRVRSRVDLWVDTPESAGIRRALIHATHGRQRPATVPVRGVLRQ